MKLKVFEFPVFNLELKVIVCKNVLKGYKKHYKVKHPDSNDNKIKGLFTQDIGEKTCSIIITKEASAGVIAHELFHFIEFFGKRIYASDESELLAYHMGYLMDEILQFINTCKKD
jgi:hypothetical protein